MSYAIRYRVPDVIEVGFETDLSATIYDADGAAVTPTAGTLTLYSGTETLVDAQAVTPGATNTYTVTASASEGYSLSDRGLAVWTLTIAGRDIPFQRPVYIVRRAYRPTITDADLQGRDSDALNILPSGITTARRYREDGHARIEKDLIIKGRRPHLIFDAWMLRDAHLAIALHFLYQDAAIKFSGENRYADAAAAYLAEYKSEMERVNFRYDDDETGTITSSERESADSVTMVTAGPGRRWMRGRRY